MKELTLLLFLLSFIPLIFGSCHAADEGPKKDSKIRDPVVAGQFYPGKANALNKMLDDFFKNVQATKISGKVYGLISPHAGYIYSGIVAAAGFEEIDSDIGRVFVLAPSHRYALAKASILDVDYYKTPLGNIPLSKIAKKLRKMDLFSSVPEMHEQEHSLEVQLPFLQKILPKFELIPIVVGNDVDPDELAGAIFPYIDEKTLIVASSDLSHYHPYETAKRLDQSCIESIVNFNFDRVKNCEACGKIPILTLMRISQKKGGSATLINYKNSGDTAGQKESVVGYASIAFSGDNKTAEEGEDIEYLSLEDKKYLLQLARNTIEEQLTNSASSILSNSGSTKLSEKRGCFVTLHKNGMLRGCIGTILPMVALCDCIKKNAINAAFNDPRFPSLKKEELDNIEIEISVLTVPREIIFSDAEDLLKKLRPNIDGVIISKGFASATFLPQVWEQLPDKEQFLSHLCQKAGLDSNCWRDSAIKVEVYQAAVYSESKLSLKK